MSYAIGHARFIQSGFSATTECFSDMISPITQELVNIAINTNTTTSTTNTVYPTWAGTLS